MNDRQSAAILIGVAVVWFVLWYYRRNEEERATLFGVGEPGTSPTRGEKAVVGGTDRSAGSTGKPLDDLLAFAHAHGLRVTSTNTGVHVKGSLHYLGRAVDVGGRDLTDQMVNDIIGFAKNAGIHVIDERHRMPWKEWSGPHLHLSIPTIVGGRTRY